MSTSSSLYVPTSAVAGGVTKEQLANAVSTKVSTSQLTTSGTPLGVPQIDGSGTLTVETISTGAITSKVTASPSIPVRDNLRFSVEADSLFSLSNNAPVTSWGSCSNITGASFVLPGDDGYVGDKPTPGAYVNTNTDSGSRIASSGNIFPLYIQSNGGYTNTVLMRFTQAPRSDERIFSAGTDTVGGDTILMARSGTTNKILFYMYNDSSGFIGNNVTAAAPLVQDEWNVLTMNWNNVTKIMTLYQNNVNIYSNSFPGISIHDRLYQTAFVGCDFTSGSVAKGAQFGCAYVWDRSLSATEMTAVYNYIAAGYPILQAKYTDAIESYAGLYTPGSVTLTGLTGAVAVGTDSTGSLVRAAVSQSGAANSLVQTDAYGQIAPKGINLDSESQITAGSVTCNNFTLSNVSGARATFNNELMAYSGLYVAHLYVGEGNPVPTITTGIACGTNGTASFATDVRQYTDTCGVISIQTGSGATSGEICSITFGKSYEAQAPYGPTVMLTPATTLAGIVGAFPQTTSPTGWTLHTGNQSLASSTLYQWNYLVLG